MIKYYNCIRLNISKCQISSIFYQIFKNVSLHEIFYTKKGHTTIIDKKKRTYQMKI